jgi:hypothetical protein
VNAERENAAAARTLTSFLLIDFAIFQILLFNQMLYFRYAI